MAMFLKIVRGCPDEFLAVAATPALDYDIYDEVVSCHFTRFKEPGPDGVFGMAHIKVREPVKTADCPGYAEIEKNVDLTGAAFLMNQQGRTIDKFLPQAARCNAGAPSVDDDFLTRITYDTAAEIRRCAMFAASNAVGGAKAGALKVVDLMNRLQVAVDAKPDPMSR